MEKKSKQENDGILLIAIIFLLYAAIAGLVTMLGFISGFAPGETANDRVMAMGIAAIIAMSLAIPGIGLMLHKSWSRLVGIIAAIISLIGFIVIIINELRNNELENTILPFISIVAFIGVIYYLTRPKVKEMFR